MEYFFDKIDTFVSFVIISVSKTFYAYIHEKNSYAPLQLFKPRTLLPRILSFSLTLPDQTMSPQWTETLFGHLTSQLFKETPNPKNGNPKNDSISYLFLRTEIFSKRRKIYAVKCSGTRVLVLLRLAPNYFAIIKSKRVVCREKKTLSNHDYCYDNCSLYVITQKIVYFSKPFSI